MRSSVHFDEIGTGVLEYAEEAAPPKPDRRVIEKNNAPDGVLIIR